MRKVIAWIAGVLCSGVASGIAFAQPPSGPDSNDTFSIVWENDIFGGTDRNYTNGVRASYLSSKRTPDVQGPEAFLAERILDANPAKDEIRYGLALGHSIFTPEDTQSRAPLPGQHPYAGFLYGEYNIFVNREVDYTSLSGKAEEGRTLDRLTLQLGLVGRWAGGNWVQNTIHDLIDDDEVRGWDNQLKNEPTIAVGFERKWRAREIFGDPKNSFGMDVVPSTGITVGTSRIHASAGAVFRIGFDMDDDYGPPRVLPGLGGGGFFEPDRPASLYMFAGVEGRAVGRNIFLDGNTYKDSASVDKKPFVADIQAGVVWQVGDTQLSYTFVHRTEEFNGQPSPQQFGAFSFGLKL